MECYKEISRKFGVNEYKILADICRLLYWDKAVTTDLYKTKKIDKKTYDYLMSTWPSKKRYYRIWNDDRGDLPCEFLYEGFEYLVLKWKINGRYGRAGDLPSIVQISYEKKGNVIDYNTYTIAEVWYKAGKVLRDNDLPSGIETHYVNNVKTDLIKMSWSEGLGIYKRKNGKPVVVIESDDSIIEEWRDPRSNIMEYYRTKDLPAIITTFKKTGKQRLEWFSEKPEEYKGSKHYRFNDKPSIIDEDGTQCWTTFPELDDFKHSKYDVNTNRIYSIDDEYYDKFSKLHTRFGREDPTKPSIIKTDGTRIWYYKSVRHSLNDKPAMIKGDGTQVWYKEGWIHRDGKPAVIYPDGKEEWWTNGVKREERELLQKKLKNNDVVDKIMRMI